MIYQLILVIEEEKSIYEFSSLSEARKALVSKAVRPGREYIKKVQPSEIREMPQSARSKKKPKEYLETFYSENYLEDYYVLYDRQNPEEPKLVISGVVVKK